MIVTPNTPGILDPKSPILPPFYFEHCGIRYHVFVDVRPDRFPHGAEIDVFVPGSVESVAHVSVARGDLIAYVRGPHVEQIRAGCRAARQEWRRQQDAPRSALTPERLVADYYGTPDGVRYEVLLDVNPQHFAAGLQVSVCAVGEIEALPVVSVPAGDLLVKLGGDVADKLRLGFVASYQQAMETMKRQSVEREGSGVRR